MKLLKILLLSIYLICNLHTSLYSQSVNIAGRDANFQVIYDDTLAGATTKVLLPSVGHRGWFRIAQYQFFSGWVTFTDPGSIGLTSADSVEISMEQYANGDVPTSASVGFYEVTAAGGNPIREVLAIYDINIIQDTNPTFFSFHGTGDPEIALGTWVRFYVRVVGGFIGVGLTMRFGLMKQP